MRSSKCLLAVIAWLTLPDLKARGVSLPLTLQQSKGTGIPSRWLPNYHPLIFIFGRSKRGQNPWSAAKWLKLLSTQGITILVMNKILFIDCRK
ncbi:hypothetical protein [Nostoc sp.]|uniref:hypothetical protein n=1 Tax=Nostoc sp. TaxID=1180 RepID=UPI002FF83F19